MPKKSGGRTARARVSRPARPSSRPSAVLPVDSAVPPAQPPPGPAVGTSRPPSSYAARVQPSRVYRPPRSGGLIPITDYGYVLADLKRIGVLAGAAVVILIALTFVIH